MTVLEEFRSFVNAQMPAIHTAQYSVESFQDGKVLIMTEKQFKTINLAGESEVLNFKDVSAVEHADGILTVKGGKKSISITCSDYDYKKISLRWDAREDEGNGGE